MLLHHELCFGCGRSNLFGLLLEGRADEPGAVSARCFIKQDHQGPQPGRAHPGIIAAALSEAMAFAAGSGESAERFEMTISADIPVGTFVEIAARATSPGRAVATAMSEGAEVAAASATFPA